jgi:hypothetical protein
VIIGKFGAKTFEVSPKKILTPKDFSLTGDLNTSSEDASKKKPATTIKGPGLLKISIEMQLLTSAGVDVQSEIDGWMTLKDAAVAYPFILCGKAVSLNSFLLTSCSASDYVISKAASVPYIASASLKLEFTEYLPPGAQNSKKKKSGSAAGVTNASVANPYKTPTTVQKAAVKRVNKGMLES